jgi:endonuclease/exonuclease/phosphatase (EEP) superfamily protein YafD
MSSREILSRSLTVIVAAIVLFSVAALLGRWHWIPDVLSHFVPQYALLTAFASIGLLWCRRLGWAAAAAATCALQVALLSPYLSSIDSPSVDALSFKVFQFNVGAKSKTLDALPNWLKARAEELDVVVLFEVDSEWKNQLEELAGLFPVDASVLRDDPFGVAVFTRLPRATARIMHTAPYQLPSAVVTAAGDDTRPHITILASHSPAPDSRAAWKNRNSHFRALAEVVLSQKGEVLLAGDLNTTVWSPWFRDFTERSGLRDAQVGLGYQGTWSPYRLPIAFGIPIDHTLISDGLVSVGREYPPRMFSDHLPIITTIAVRSRSGT